MPHHVLAHARVQEFQETAVAYLVVRPPALRAERTVDGTHPKAGIDQRETYSGTLEKRKNHVSVFAVPYGSTKFRRFFSGRFPELSGGPLSRK
jgi:hypothetical protein